MKTNGYWYYRLKNTFFKDGVIRILKRKPDGYKLITILLELYCEALDNDSVIILKSNPYENGGLDDLATVIDEEARDLLWATKIFQQYDLLEVKPIDEDKVELFLTQLPGMYGKSSLKADQQRLKDRERQELPAPKEDAEQRKGLKPYGVYQNVMLTDEEISILKQKYTNSNYVIDRVSLYKRRTGTEYADDCAAVLTFGISDGAERVVRPKLSKKEEQENRYEKELQAIYKEHPRLAEINKGIIRLYPDLLLNKKNKEIADTIKQQIADLEREREVYITEHNIVMPKEGE